jgi:hypothetical protein
MPGGQGVAGSNPAVPTVSNSCTAKWERRTVNWERSCFSGGIAGDRWLRSAFPHARPRSRRPAYPFDEHAAREWVRREADSCPRDTEAQSRQVGAPWHGPKLGQRGRRVALTPMTGRD